MVFDGESAPFSLGGRRAASKRQRRTPRGTRNAHWSAYPRVCTRGKRDTERRSMEMFERPLGYVGPNLEPSTVRFRPRAFAPGVYALMASPMPRDNSGLIVGADAALLVDAGINGAVAAQLQAWAAKLTDKPLKYLVNTNYHGDHTFGNYAFPASVEIIAHKLTAQSMADLDYEKK